MTGDGELLLHDTHFEFGVFRSVILAGQLLKIIAGTAQVAFGAWLAARRPRSAISLAFAISFGANGLAYVFFNLGLPGQRAAGSLAVEGRAVCNWIASAAMLVFATLLTRSSRMKLALLSGIIVGALVFAADLLARGRLSFLQFGGIAIYPATDLVLGMLPIVFINDSGILRESSAWLAAALAINSVDHLGAEVIKPAQPMVVWLQIAAMVFVLALWFAGGFMRERRRWRAILLVVACMILPFLAGVLVRLAAGSYIGVQRSGFIGVGRLIATGLLVYGTIRASLFSTTGVLRHETPFAKT